MNTKPAKPVAPPENVDRDDVQVSVNRCPFCHDGIQIEAAGWTSCRGCQARHHEACWDEGHGCSSCGETQRLVPATDQRGRRGALLCGVGIVGSLTAVVTGQISGPLEMLRYSGVLGLVGVVAAIVLLVRVLKDLRGAADARRFERHAAWVYLVWGIGLVNLLIGTATVWSVITSQEVPPETVAYAGRQLWAGVKLTAFASLPVFLACALGLRRAQVKREAER